MSGLVLREGGPAVMSGGGVDEALWVRRFHPAPECKVRLVCFPDVGGSASFYYPLSDSLTGSVEVLALQYPGRQDRRDDPCVDSVAEFADRIAAALRPWLDRPLALFGHGLGAVLAFEVARRLERDGTTPVVLFASGRGAPSRVRDVDDTAVHTRDDEGIVRELRLLSGAGAPLLGDGDLLRWILPAVRADFTAIENYRCAGDVTVRTPINVLLGEDDPSGTPEEAADWRQHTSGAFDLRTFPGGHDYLTGHSSHVINTISDYLLVWATNRECRGS